LFTFLYLKNDAALKAEEMLLAMSRLNSSGMPNLKPDAFTYTAVIDVSRLLVPPFFHMRQQLMTFFVP
jgi:hypothetical protein